MSYQATAWAYDLPIVGPQKPVLVALADMADESGSCYPGQERIASMTGLSVATVRRALLKLETQGLIVRERRNGAYGYRTSDRYHLQLTVTVPESLPLTEPSRQRALKALSPFLPLTLHIPTAHSAGAVEPSVKPSVNHQGEPPLFCKKHPRGADGGCGGCADAGRLHAKWLRDQKSKPIAPGIVTDPDCELHPGRPARSCDRCAEITVAS